MRRARATQEAQKRYDEAATRVKTRVQNGEDTLDAMLAEGMLTQDQYDKAQDDLIQERQKEDAARQKYLEEQGLTSFNKYEDVTKLRPEQLSSGQMNLDQAKQDVLKSRQTQAVDEIVNRYGSVQNFYKERERIEKEYKYRYMAAPSEFVLNIGRTILRMPARVVQLASIVATDLNPLALAFTEENEMMKASETPFYQFADGFIKRLESSKNKDISSGIWDDTSAFVVNDLADGLVSLRRKQFSHHLRAVIHYLRR